MTAGEWDRGPMNDSLKDIRGKQAREEVAGAAKRNAENLRASIRGQPLSAGTMFVGLMADSWEGFASEMERGETPPALLKPMGTA